MGQWGRECFTRAILAAQATLWGPYPLQASSQPRLRPVTRVTQSLSSPSCSIVTVQRGYQSNLTHAATVAPSDSNPLLLWNNRQLPPQISSSSLSSSLKSKLSERTWKQGKHCMFLTKVFKIEETNAPLCRSIIIISSSSFAGEAFIGLWTDSLKSPVSFATSTEHGHHGPQISC